MFIRIEFGTPKAPKMRPITVSVLEWWMGGLDGKLVWYVDNIRPFEGTWAGYKELLHFLKTWKR